MNKKDVKNKTWKNYYWYYYKWHIFFAIFFSIAIAVCSVQCAMRVNPDCYVLYYSDTYISDEELNKITDSITKYIKDTNGDGKKKITVVNCTYPKGNTTMLSKVNSQGVMQMQTDDTCIWILDDAGKDLYYNTDAIDIFATYNKCDSDNGHSVTASGTAALRELTKATNKEFYVFARKDKNGKILNQAKNIIDGIKK